MADILHWIFATMAFVLWADIWNPKASKQRIIIIAVSAPIVITLLMTVWGFWMMATDTQGHVGAMAFASAATLLVSACIYSVLVTWPVAWLTLRYFRKSEAAPTEAAPGP